jgi:Tol biopolymer transport system component
VWFDRTGRLIDKLGDLSAYETLELSPDGKRASVSIEDQGTRNIWLYDLARGLRMRFMFDPASADMPIWSPDGSRIVFNSLRKGHRDLYQKASSGAGAEEVLLQDSLEKFPFSWSPDDKFILYTAMGNPGTGMDLFVLPLSGDRKPFPFLKTPFNEGQGKFSPDGRWVAYRSDESGRYEMYVAPFPGAGASGGFQQAVEAITGGGAMELRSLCHL